MKICLLGSGNIATQLATLFKKKGHTLVFVYSRTLKNASRLGKKIGCPFGTNLQELKKYPADVYIIAVKDDAIYSIVKQMPSLKDELVMHVSGATDLEVLKNKFKNCGALWQVQTHSVVKNSLPASVVIECNNTTAKKKLLPLAKCVSKNVYSLNSRQRRIVHLGAVFVNNFPNHLYTIAQSLLKKNKLPFEILKPLMLATAQNGTINPILAQTGPAKRNDKKTMNAHKKLLTHKEHLKIYELLSSSIVNRWK
jgi:predicted short-subunit dehydrogenase-like oxidoreductase (DUF2520 family)